LPKAPKKKESKLIISVGLRTGERFSGEPTDVSLAELKYLWQRDEQCVHIRDGDLVVSIPSDNIAWMTRGPKTIAEIAQQKRAEIQAEIRKAAEEIRQERDAAVAIAVPEEIAAETGLIQPGDGRTAPSAADQQAIADALKIHSSQAGVGNIARHQKRIEVARGPNVSLRRVADTDEP